MYSTVKSIAALLFCLVSFFSLIEKHSSAEIEAEPRAAAQALTKSNLAFSRIEQLR